MQIFSTRGIASFLISAQLSSWLTIHEKDIPGHTIWDKGYAGDQDTIFKKILIYVLHAFNAHEYLGTFQNWLLFFRHPSEETTLVLASWSRLWFGGGMSSSRLLLPSCGQGINPGSSRNRQCLMTTGHRRLRMGSGAAEPRCCSRTGAPPDRPEHSFWSLWHRDAFCLPGGVRVRHLANRIQYGACLFGKLWYLDRMAWLWEDMKDADPEYRKWRIFKNP
jgi:hypothetical protein